MFGLGLALTLYASVRMTSFYIGKVEQLICRLEIFHERKNIDWSKLPPDSPARHAQVVELQGLEEDMTKREDGLHWMLFRTLLTFALGTAVMAHASWNWSSATFQ